jgi:hypothetical protein
VAGSTDVLVKFLADTKAFRAETEKVKGQTTKIKGWMKGVGVAIGAAFAIRAVGDWVDAASEAESVSRKLRTTFKNAGDATGAWADHAEKLADSMQRKIGVDDEAIKGAQILLSTSKGLASTMDKQPEIFDRATKAAADLSKSGFGDLQGAAKALTKAFEDPEKGLGALRRAGIFFTEDEKKVIQSFLDTGDVAGAYNIILGKVEGKVGGVAEKSATASDKMKVAWDEAKESLGKALLPVLENIAPKIEALAGFIEKNANWLIPMTIGVVALVIALKLWIGAQTILNGLLATFGVEATIAVGPIFLVVFAVLAAYAAVVLLYAKWDQVWSWIGNLPWYAKVAIMIAVVTNPVLLLILAVAALAVYWSDIWGALGPIVKRAVEFAKGWIDDLVGALERIVGAADAARHALENLSPFGGGGSGADLQKAGQRASGGGGFKIPTGFFHAAGGIFTRPTLGVIAEAGAEAVIPLNHADGFGNTTLIVNVTSTGLGASSAQIQSSVADALRQYQTRNGPL